MSSVQVYGTTQWEEMGRALEENEQQVKIVKRALDGSADEDEAAAVAAAQAAADERDVHGAAADAGASVLNTSVAAAGAGKHGTNSSKVGGNASMPAVPKMANASKLLSARNASLPPALGSKTAPTNSTKPAVTGAKVPTDFSKGSSNTTAPAAIDTTAKSGANASRISIDSSAVLVEGEAHDLVVAGAATGEGAGTRMGARLGATTAEDVQGDAVAGATMRSGDKEHRVLPLVLPPADAGVLHSEQVGVGVGAGRGGDGGAVIGGGSRGTTGEGVVVDGGPKVHGMAAGVDVGYAQEAGVMGASRVFHAASASAAAAAGESDGVSTDGNVAAAKGGAGLFSKIVDLVAPPSAPSAAATGGPGAAHDDTLPSLLPAASGSTDGVSSSALPTISAGHAASQDGVAATEMSLRAQTGGADLEAPSVLPHAGDERDDALPGVLGPSDSGLSKRTKSVNALGQDPLYVALPRLLVPPESWDGGDVPLPAAGGVLGDGTLDSGADGGIDTALSLDSWLGVNEAAAESDMATGVHGNVTSEQLHVAAAASTFEWSDEHDWVLDSQMVCATEAAEGGEHTVDICIWIF